MGLEIEDNLLSKFSQSLKTGDRRKDRGRREDNFINNTPSHPMQSSRQVFRVGCQKGISTGRFPLHPPNLSQCPMGSLSGHAADLVRFLI